MLPPNHKASNNKLPVVAIVQARMSSERFRGKTLAEIAGRPMLWHVVDRVRRARLIDKVIVATSIAPEDDAIEQFCTAYAIACFRGDLDDVLDRVYRAARTHHARTVARLTADCPLLDPAIVDRVVEVYLRGNFDYVTNALRYTYPDGLDVEVFSFKALERAWQDATLPSEREHVTPYLRFGSTFARNNVEAEVDTSRRRLRWTVDSSADLEFVREVYARLRPAEYSWLEALRVIEQEPQLTEINEQGVLNEGFYRSLMQDGLPKARAYGLEASLRLKAEAERLIPGLSQTFSKGPTQFIQGVAPVYLERGDGYKVWDVDGNEYIDWSMALAAIMLGYVDSAVTEAVVEQARQGSSFSLSHPLEIDVAEMLTERIPCADMVRFGKNGSDATAGAVRLARAITGRNIVACCGYHGWQDWFIGSTTRDAGVPKQVKDLTVPFAYNDVDSLQRVFDSHHGQVAAVIMEPVGVIEPTEEFLSRVRDLTHRHGTLLIFDEVVTGFRVSRGGAQEYFGVTPDLACFGKSMANGYPLSAIVGPTNLMRQFDEVFFSSTFGGETLSLAAAKATMAEIDRRNVVRHIWEVGQRIRDGYNHMATAYGLDDTTRCVGLPCRTLVMFQEPDGRESLVLKSLFQQECLKRGVLFTGAHNVAASHTHAVVNETLRVYGAAMARVADAINSGAPAGFLEGPPVQDVFRKP